MLRIVLLKKEKSFSIAKNKERLMFESHEKLKNIYAIAMYMYVQIQFYMKIIHNLTILKLTNIHIRVSTKIVSSKIKNNAFVPNINHS